MDLTITSETLADDDRDWLASSHGTNTADTVTLDGSAFTGTWTDGVIPSGVALGKIASTGLYAPFDGGSSEVQSVVATGGTAGDFTFEFGGETTAPIAYNASAAAVQTALLALTNINEGDVVCTGGPLPTTAVVITFGGQYAGVAVPSLVVTDNITGGTATVSVTTEGGAGEATDGTQNGVGILYTAAKVIGADGNTHDVGAAILRHGQIVQANLPTNHGVNDEFKKHVPGLTFI